MFTDDPDEYLLGLKNFLLALPISKEDPAVPALINEIYRELLRRASLEVRGTHRPAMVKRHFAGVLRKRFFGIQA